MKKLLAGLLAVGLLASLVIPFTQVSAAVTIEDSIIVDGVRYSPDTETLRPNAAGDLTQLTPSAGANWECVDEAVANDDTDYVSTGAGGIDLYNMPASAGAGVISKITVHFRCKSSDKSQGFVGAYIKSNGTTGEGAWQHCTDNDTWEDFFEEWALNPDDAAAWEWADIDDLQIGVQIGIGFFETHYCTQVYVVVDYTAPPDPPTNFVASDNLTDRVTCTWTKSVGATKYQLYRDGIACGAELGDVDTTDDMTAAAPVITAGDTVATDGDFSGKVVLSVAGESVADGTTYTYKVRAGNAAGWSGDSNTDNGHREPGAITYQHQEDDGGWGNIVGGTTDPYDYAGAPKGTVVGGNGDASDGTAEAHSVLTVAGHSVANGASRNYRTVISATGAANQTSGANTGYTTPGAFSYQWLMSGADADAGYGNIGGATSNPYNATEFPANGDGRWAYCEVSAVDATNNPQDSTHDRGFRAVAPTATSVGCSGFARDWAIVNATVDTVGLPASVTEVGFDYGLTTGYGNSSTKTGTWATNDEFWMKLTGLTPGTVYHARAKVWNGVWGYGADFVFSTEGSPTLYEYLNTGGDAVGDDIYTGNWAYMQFTVGTVAHSLDFSNLYLIRTGAAPGDAVLSLKHADGANKPTGADIDIMTLDADLFSVALDWVKFDFPLDWTLEAGESYALVLRCPTGTNANYLEWRWDAGGALANAIAGKSADSGITWTAEGTADYLFENWGEPVFEVVGAKVFTGYRVTGDWLVVFTYRNYFTPYYMTSICRDNFYVRLLDDTTVIAQIGCPTWGYRPGSFYFSKALADAMEWGVTDYKVRLYGDFGAFPYSDYNIAVADWGGAVDPFLDAWVIQAANIIGDDLGIALTETIADKGEVLNAMGHIWFSIGIPYLNEIRPELFEMVSQKPPYEEEDYTHELQGETDWEVRLGADIAGVLTDGGDLIGLDGDEFGGIITFIAFILVVSLLTLGGHLVIGLGMGYPILLAGAWFGLISWIIVGVITFLAVAIFVYKVWLVR